MMWCYCGQSIENIEIPTVLKISKDNQTKEVKDEVKEEVKVIVEEKKEEVKVIIDEKEKKIEEEEKNKDKYKCKIYEFQSLYHLVLDEPFNMIIILGNEIIIEELKNINNYKKDKYEYVLVDKNWINECYKTLNDQKIIYIKKILLKQNCPNMEFFREISSNLIIENSDIIMENSNIIIENSDIIIENSNIIVEDTYVFSGNIESLVFNPATIFLNENINNKEDKLPNATEKLIE